MLKQPDAAPLPETVAASSDTVAGAKRHIRSFVLRQGRMTPAQQRAFGEHWSRYGLEPGKPIGSWTEAFGRDAPVILEIGFGNGEQLLWSGRQESDCDFVGIEVHRPGVGRLMNALAANNVDNVRLYNHDAIDVLERCIPAASVAGVRIFFPDPWPKQRQQKRRLIQPDFLGLLARHVRPGGVLHLATDWADYARHMHEVLERAPDWRNLHATPFAPRPESRIQTRFERRGLLLGHGVWDLLYERRS